MKVLTALCCVVVFAVLAPRVRAQDGRAVFDSDFLYPTYTSSLRFLRRETVVTELILTEARPPLFHIWWREADGAKSSATVRMGESFGKASRFSVVDYHQESRLSAVGVPVDHSQLTLSDAENDSRLVLMRNTVLPVPLLFAVFEITDQPNSPLLVVQQHKHFTFPGDPPHGAQVVAIEEHKVRVRCDEKEFDVLAAGKGLDNLRVYSEEGNLFVDIPKGLELEFTGSRPGISPALPSNVHYQTNSFFWGIVEAGPKAMARLGKPVTSELVPTKFPALPGDARAPSKRD